MDVLPCVPDQEGNMSFLYHTHQKTDLEHRDYEYRDATGAFAGFILALVCLALALVVASAVFAPAPVGSGINFNEITSVGP
jgi:hypothetical protein